MTFKHQRVDQLIIDTNEQREHMLTYMNDNEPDPKYEVKFDGLMVSPEVAQLCGALQRRYRRLKFGVSVSCHAHWPSDTNVVSNGLDVRCYKELWVYFEDQEYALFKVGHADYGVTKNDIKYGIYARGLKNAKFKANDRYQHYMNFSDSYDKIMAIARGQMRPYTVSEIAKLSHDPIYNNVYQHNSNLKSSVGDFWINLRNHSQLGQELLNVLDSGYTFLSDELKQRVIEYKQSLEVKASIPTAYHAYFIYVNHDPVYNTTMCDVLLFTDIHKHESRKKPPAETNRLPLEDLPEDLAGKLAALNMLNIEDFLPDVGIKISDRSFWVLR